MTGIYHYAGETNKVEHTHTLQEFIAMGNSIDAYDYLRFSMVEMRDGVPVVIHNVLDDYIDDLREQCLKIVLTAKQVDEYRYNPKKLSFKLYGTTTLYHIILKLNNLANAHEFTLRDGSILLFSASAMKEIISAIYSSERHAIYTYNSAHSSDTVPTITTNDRLGNRI